MLIVADSSPLNYLVRIELVHVLPGLFTEILIPPIVADELSTPTTPQPVRKFIARRPAWLTVRSPSAHRPPLNLSRASIPANRRPSASQEN